MRKNIGLDSVEIMGHLQTAGPLAGRCEIDRCISLETVPLGPLFGDSETFELSEPSPLIELFRPYEYIVTFMADKNGCFERNLIYTTTATHAAEVVTVDLKGPPQTGEHSAEYFVRQFVEQVPGLQMSPQNLRPLLNGPLLKLNQTDGELGRQILAKNGITTEKNIIGIHPGSGGLHKCWPIGNFCQIIDLADQKGLLPVVLWGPAEQDRFDKQTKDSLAQRAVLLQDLDINEVIAVMACLLAYVGNDSGISHLAAGLGAPSVVVFGPSNDTHWRPLGQNVAVMRTEKYEKDEWPTHSQVFDRLIDFL